MGGLADFNNHSIKLAYGEDSPLIKDGHIAAVQSLSGEERGESAARQDRRTTGFDRQAITCERLPCTHMLCSLEIRKLLFRL